MSTSGISKKLIYLRMVGYAATLAMHTVNAVRMHSIFSSDDVTDLDIKQFNENQFMFLTVWNVCLQTLYATIGLSCDIISLAKENKAGGLLKTLKIIRDNIFAAVLFPISLTVFSVFWPVFSYERSLILPPSVDKALGSTSNQIIHTMIVPVVSWEVLCRPRRIPKSHTLNLVQLNMFVGVYLVVLVTSYIQQGVWVYAILNILDSTIYFYVFLGVAVVFVQIFYYLQWYLTHLVWGNPEKLEKFD